MQVLEKSGSRIGGGERLFDTGGAHSLDDVVLRLTESLTVRGNAACLVCGATFVRSGERRAEAAECSGCGSRFE